MLDFARLQNETAKYIKELQDGVSNDPENLEKLDTLAEAYFETGEAELAFPLLEKSVSLDPEGKNGSQKFFWLGQIFGGRTGIDFYQRGLAASNNTPAQTNEALLGMIEIWMTDLCMEPEAEQQCEELINAAIANRPEDAEAFSVLGSIRISQQRPEDAVESLAKSWDLFVDDFENSRFDHNVLPKLLRLAQNMIELEMSELVLEVTGQLHRMDDQIPEVYYLNVLAHKSLAEQTETPLEKSKHIVAVKDAAELIKALDEPADPEIVEAIQTIAQSLPAPEIENPYQDEDNTAFELK